MNALTRLLVWILTAVVAVRFVLYTGQVGFALLARGDVTYPEGAVIYAVRRVAAGEPLYQDFRQPPHIAVIYGPVFFYLAGWADRSWGTGPFGSYVVARSVTLGAFAGVVSLFACWVRKLAGGWAGGLFITMLMAACPTFWGVGVSARPDSLALLASTAALGVALRPWSAWRWAFVWLFAVLAWTCKQNALAVVPALACYLFQQRGILSAVMWLAAWAAGVAGTWLFLHWQTGGLFTLNTFVALGRPVDWAGAGRIVREQSIHLAVVFALAASCWPVALRSASLRLPAWWFGFALLLGAGSLLGEGSGANYLLEAWVPACLLATQALAGGPRSVRARPASAPALPGDSTSQQDRTAAAGADRTGRWSHRVRWVWYALLIVVSANDVFYYRRTVGSHIRLAVETPAYQRQMGHMPKLLPLVVRYPGEVFIQYPYLSLVSHRSPVVLDVLHYRQLVDRRVVAGEILANQFAEQHYDLVVLNEDLETIYKRNKLMRWPEVVWSSLVEHYRFAGRVDGYYVYVPAERDE